jgi:hypothetical protein
MWTRVRAGQAALRGRAGRISAAADLLSSRDREVASVNERQDAGGAASRLLFAAVLFAAVLFAAGCAPGSAPEPEPDPGGGEGEPAVSVDGVPVDCTRLTVVATASARPRVTVARPEGVEVDVALDGVDVRDRFGSQPLLAAALELPADRPVVLEVARVGAAEWRCTARLVHRAAAEQGLADLRAASAAEVVVTRSSETGSVSSAVLEVPAEGATPSERAARFLDEHADVLAVPAWQLRELEHWSSPDGWTTVVFEQWLEEDVLAFESALEVELDPEGAVRTLHAQLYPDLEAAPAFALDPGAAVAAAEAAIGPADGFRRVVHDRLDPRPGWYVEGEGGTALVDDASGEVRWTAPPYFEVPMELHHPVPNPLLDTRRGVPSSTSIARGDTAGAPPSGLDAEERAAWSTVASIVGRVQARTGRSGWRGSPIRLVTQSAVAEGTIMLPDGTTARTPGAFYVPGRALMFLDGAARQREDTICHEYGHAFDDARGGTTRGTFAECMGDVFYLFCEPWVNGGRADYAYNGSARRHDRPHGRPDQFDYDAFRALGIRESRIGRGATVGGRPVGVHDHAFLVTHALYQMMETHDLDREKAAQLGFGAAAGRYATYPELRDRVLSDAVSWARSGRHGFTEADVCAVAQGFRHTKLDGEYGAGADCERTDRADLVCTSHFCPVCGDDEPPSVCRPETLAEGQPVCTTADGRRTCVGSIALSGEGCPDGQGRQCWCVGDGRWDCSSASECRPFSSRPLYCPEDGPPATAGPGGATPSCRAVVEGPGGAGGAVWLVPLLALLLRRRR